jgi:hypothetical protein
MGGSVMQKEAAHMRDRAVRLMAGQRTPEGALTMALLSVSVELARIADSLEQIEGMLHER